MTTARNAAALILLLLTVFATSSCAGPSTQRVTPPNAGTHQTQVIQGQPFPGCDLSTMIGCPQCDLLECWIIPCYDCIVPVPILDEGAFLDGGGGGGGITPVEAPPQDVVDQITVPNQSSTGQLPSPGDTVQCVDGQGSFTTGCGGLPGVDGQGIGVFYDSLQTCYFNFDTQAHICFAAANGPARFPSPGGDRTTTYCYDRAKLHAQHWYTLPDTDSGVETFDTYIDITDLMEATFTITAPHASTGLTLWISAGPYIVIPDSTSHVQMFALESVPGIPFVKVPVYVGWALRTHTDSLCKQSF
jgi:hypothetical protein